MKNTEAGDFSMIGQALANNVKILRDRLGFSMNELAAKAGIGKSTLSVLEAGNGNPNIETIWALASALKVPFGQLLDTSSFEMRIIRKGEGILVDTGDKIIQAKLLVSRSRRGAFELYQVEIGKGANRLAEPHAKGTVEHICVQSGQLITGTADSPSKIKAGDLISFPADVPHVYQTPAGGVSALLMVDYQ